jgi:hypothetical protein
MIVCPFCHFSNEEGALFCEQCKSDLSGVAPEPVAAAAVVEPIPVVPVAPVEPFPAAPVMEVAAVPVEPIAEVPVLPVMEVAPVEVAPVEVAPVEVAPVPVAPEPVAPPPPPPPPVVAEPPPPPPPAPPAAAPVAAAPAAAAGDGSLPAGAQPKLVVQRGQRPKAEYPIYEGLNFIGRADEKPVDIDLEDQEPPDRVWCSRQHAVIEFQDNKLTLEDLNSSNGTYLNRGRVFPGQKQALKPNDIIQIGNVQMKVVV